MLGLGFAVPGTYFLARGFINGALGRRLGVLFLMGGAQGLVGWWMVRSGLKVGGATVWCGCCMLACVVTGQLRMPSRQQSSLVACYVWWVLQNACSCVRLSLCSSLGCGVVAACVCAVCRLADVSRGVARLAKHCAAATGLHGTISGLWRTLLPPDMRLRFHTYHRASLTVQTSLPFAGAKEQA